MQYLDAILKMREWFLFISNIISIVILTHWKRLWCWEGLEAREEGDDRGWDGWMASPTWWMWVWVISGSWWWTGRPGVLWFMGSQRVGHDWVTELNWAMKVIEMTQTKERYIMFLDWKNQYFQNECTAQSNLQIQCNSYQITEALFTELEWKILQFVWKYKRPWIANVVLRKENSWRNQAPWPQTILQS